jgi:hypothetical protein
MTRTLLNDAFNHVDGPSEGLSDKFRVLYAEGLLYLGVTIVQSVICDDVIISDQKSDQ